MDKYLIRIPKGEQKPQANNPIKNTTPDQKQNEQKSDKKNDPKKEELKKIDEKKTPIKAKNTKMEEEKSIASSIKNQQTPKKLIESNSEKKIIPSQNKNDNKIIPKSNVSKGKMEVEGSATEELSDSKTESLTQEEKSLSEIEEAPKKTNNSKSKGKMVIDDEDDDEEQNYNNKLKQQTKQQPITSNKIITPDKPISKNKNNKYDEDFEENEEEEEDPFSKFNYSNKKDNKNKTFSRRLVNNQQKKKNENTTEEEEDDEEEQKDEIIEIKKTTNRTKAIEQKKQETPQKKQQEQASKTNKSASKGQKDNSNLNQNNGGDQQEQLKGEIIVFTGELDGVSRETVTKIVTSYGGKCTGSVSGKTTILVHGSILEDGRPPEQGKKYQEAKNKGTKIMNQSAFSDFLENKIGKNLDELSNSSQGGNRFNKFAAAPNNIQSTATTTTAASNNNSNSKKKLIPVNLPKQQQKYDPKNKNAAASNEQQQQKQQIQQNNNSNNNNNQMGGQMRNINSAEDQLWTHKHQPSNINNCVGNQMNFEKMMTWLQDWVDVVIKGNKKQVKNTFYNRANPAGVDNTSNVNAKACLLSGPPGVGKTTSVRLIAKFMGYEVREWNASDQRSKKSVNSIIGELKSNSILHLIKKTDHNNDGETEAKSNKKFIILMDEVDGMSSGDRGGNQALIDAIKNTSVPIFCICNDRMSPKIRSLANYCYDIKFNKPPKQDIAKHMQKICEKEGYTQVDKEALEVVSERFGNDLRQTLNYLEMHFKNNKTLQNKDLKSLTVGQKDATVMMEGFEASTQLMQSYKFQKLTLRERIELFFIDYDLIPLLIHQNYLDTIQPRTAAKPKNDNKNQSKNNKDDKKTKSDDTKQGQFSIEELQNIVSAASSIGESDILSKQIRTNGNWSLLNNFAFLSSIYPCDKACEDKPIYPRFPEWLGKYQTTKKTNRELREFMISISKSISGSRFAVKFDYVPVMLKIILNTLKKGNNDANIDHVLNFLDNYHIKPEHLKEHLNDLQYPKMDYYSEIPTDTKSKLTREYNKRFSDDSRKIKAPKKAPAKSNGEAKYDKNLDDVIYSETEKQSSDNESGKEDENGNDDKNKNNQNDGIKSKLNIIKTNVAKKGAKNGNKKNNTKQNKKGKKSGDEDTEEMDDYDQNQTNSLDSFINDDDDY